MITTSIPSTWQDLQQHVAQILSECGFLVDVERSIATVRGNVNIDVFAEETVRGRRYTILSECKYWKAAVPQNVIHGFRTVVGDVGAHKGYIISTSGFQSGSFKAADLTNIELVTWEQFQQAFELSWLVNHFSPTLLKRLAPLMTFSEHFLPTWFDDLPKAAQEAHIELKEQNDELGWVTQHLAMLPRVRGDSVFPALPLSTSLGDTYDFSQIPADVAGAQGYRELLEAAVTHGERAIAKYRAIRDEHIRS
jgi:restriction system protein